MFSVTSNFHCFTFDEALIWCCAALRPLDPLHSLAVSALLPRDLSLIVASCLPFPSPPKNIRTLSKQETRPAVEGGKQEHDRDEMLNGFCFNVLLVVIIAVPVAAFVVTFSGE